MNDQEWEEKVVEEHNEAKPFAPENGQELKFKVGDAVTFTNDYGVTFHGLHITGLYKPELIDSFYARGFRYLLDYDCHWFPVREESLTLEVPSAAR